MSDPRWYAGWNGAAPWWTGFRAIATVALSTVGGCATSIPDVGAFASGTATLYVAHDTESEAIIRQYEGAIDLARRLQSARPSPLDSAELPLLEVVDERLQTSLERFVASRRAFDEILRLAVGYSEALTELAAAGGNGSEAARSLAGSLNEFGTLTGVGTIITGSIASAIERISAIATQVQARGSLQDATRTAQPAVDTVASLLKQIHAEQYQQLVTALASDTDQLLAWEVGSGMIGYYREATARRHTYYRRALLTLQQNDDGISGFCHAPDTAAIDETCINLRELEALREVEGLLRALAPEIERYEAKRTSLAAWRDLRRANGERIVKALDAWRSTHERVQRALAERTGVSAFPLTAILAGIETRR